MSKEHETLIDAALALDDSLSPPVIPPVKPERSAGNEIPADATEVPDRRDLAADRPGKTTGKE